MGREGSRRPGQGFDQGRARAASISPVKNRASARLAAS
jgi:hypothetical protein